MFKYSLTNILISIMIVGYLVIGWSWIREAQPTLEPGQGKTELIVNPIIHIGESIELAIATTVDQSHCSVVSERHIINDKGIDVHPRWTIIPNHFLVEMLDGVTIHLKVPLPRLEPGNYFYMSTIHLTCPGGTSYLRSTDHLPFQIIP